MEQQRSNQPGRESTSRGGSFDDLTVCVEEHGYEAGAERFPRGSDKVPPRIATWRNNLTALSQHRNLYFVAYSSQIHVYQPSGYAQTIGSTPALILTPQLKNINAPGYISAQVPHALNSIVVGDLGQEEILLLGTDSGNIAAYRTERIFAAITEKEISGVHNPEDAAAHVECFFSEWVGLSAWGLAIHKYARLIAVGSNTTYITVFAFALVNRPSESGVSESSDACTTHDDPFEWHSITGRLQYGDLRLWTPEYRRSRNIRLTLYGHATNIPNISFLNSSLDSEGNWLFSIDIDNRVLAWRIWDHYQPIHSWNFPQPSVRRQNTLDDHQRGWNVLPIDPHAFRGKSSVGEACGGRPHLSNRGSVYDLTHLGEHVQNSNRHYDYFPPMELPGPNSCAVEIGGPQSDESFSGSFDGSSRPGSPLETDLSNPDLAEEIEDVKAAESLTDLSRNVSNLNSGRAETTEDNARQTVAADSHPSEEAITDEIAEEQLPDESPSLGPTRWPSPDHPIWEILRTVMGDEGDDVETDAETDDLDFMDGPPVPMELELGHAANILHTTTHRGEEIDESDMEQSDENLLDDTAVHHELRSLSDDSSSDGILHDFDFPPIFSDFPILQFSESHIRMISGPEYPSPSIIFRAPLHQSLTQAIPTIEACDRFNMVQEVPELGIVVAASQKGRVAILSLTQVPGEGRFFRVDRIIPFDNQEKFGLRPLCPLLGIAVGPVESHLVPLGGPNSSRDDDDEMADTLSKPNIHEHTSESGSCSPNHTQGKPATTGYNVKRESWHGNEYSRRFRIFLAYCDHTIMHYEIYYDWPSDIKGTGGIFMNTSP